MTVAKPILGVFFCCVIGLPVGLSALLDKPQMETPSTYAPAADLQRYIDLLMQQLEEDLAQQASYNIPRIKRVLRNANTLAAVASVLGQHDQANAFQASSTAITQASLAVAAAAEDYSQAKSALTKLQEVLEKTPPAAEPSWGAVGDIEQLMLQVPVLARDLRKHVRGTAFAVSRDEAAAFSAALAAVAQVSEFDHTYCDDQRKQQVWDELCRQMRDAAAQCNAAVRAGRRLAARDSLKELTRSCDNCHDQFRENGR